MQLAAQILKPLKGLSVLICICVLTYIAHTWSVVDLGLEEKIVMLASVTDPGAKLQLQSGKNPGKAPNFVQICVFVENGGKSTQILFFWAL